MKITFLKVISLCYYFINASWPSIALFMSLLNDVLDRFPYCCHAIFSFLKVLKPLIIRVLIFLSELIKWALKILIHIYFDSSKQRKGYCF